MCELDLQAIGVVRSEAVSAHGLPHYGLPARIEVFPEFADGLLGIENSTHIIVIGWLHEADRSVLQVHRPSYDRLLVRRGVFACRSPVRPNPLGVTTVRLVRVSGTTLHVDGLDMVDGTPVLDLKPHSSGFDGVFCARSARDLSRLADPDPDHAFRSMLREAQNFHGELCSGIAVAARMVYHVMKSLDVAQKDPGVTVSLGGDGCVADGVQALSGATFGNRRLALSSGSSFEFSYGDRSLCYTPRSREKLSVEDVLSAGVDDLFEIRTKDIQVGRLL